MPLVLDSSYIQVAVTFGWLKIFSGNRRQSGCVTKKIKCSFYVSFQLPKCQNKADHLNEKRPYPSLYYREN